MEIDVAMETTQGVGKAQQRTLTLALDGEIGPAEFHEVSKKLFELAQKNVTQLVVDFTDVSHFDYRFVRPLKLRAQLFREAGGDVKLAGLSNYLFAIFRSAGAHDAFDYFSTAPDAVRAFEPPFDGAQDRPLSLGA